MDTTLRNCASCGQLYRSQSNKICPACQQKESQQIIFLRNYVGNHRVYSLTELSSATKIPLPRIKTWIRTGKLVLPKNLPNVATCLSCGATLQSGQYCPTCVQKRATNSVSVSGSSKMRFLTRRKKS